MPHLFRNFGELQALARERRPVIALILGSGLSDIADRLEDVAELPFARIPGLEAPGVAGHRGVLLLGQWAAHPVLVFAGRLHYYEGRGWNEVVRPVHVAHELGATMLIATNAAGGIRGDLNPGDLMALSGHLDCTKSAWWRAPAIIRNNTYSTEMLNSLQDLGLSAGVYAQLTGPCYETPAEIRALRFCGVDAVGMSTGREIEAGSALGMDCAAISCITNKAAGLGSGAIHHSEVLEVGRRVREKLVGLLERLIAGSIERRSRDQQE